MTEAELKLRTKLFARRVLHLVEALPRTRSAMVVAGQLGRAATSVGANYRSACRARSTADFISQLGIVEEEADESAFWMELITEETMLPEAKVQPLWQEAGALTAIMVSSRKTLGLRNQKPKTKIQK